MYKSLTKTKKYSELEAHETLKRVISANAIIKHYKSSSLIIVKRHAMVLSYFKSYPCCNKTYYDENSSRNFIAYKPSVLCTGHRQTVHTQNRHHPMRCLIRFCIV